MTDINELEIHWEKVSWVVSTRISTDMSNIKDWGELFYLETTSSPKVLVEFEGKICKIQIYDTKVYTGTEFPTDQMKNKIAKSLLKNHEKNGDIYKYILLDQDYQLFAGRVSYNTEWVFLGIRNKDWKPLNFNSYCDWFEKYGIETAGPDLYWIIGNQLFRTPSMYSERVLGIIVLADYCDKFIPKKDGEVKPVSFWGFATLVIFLRKILGDKKIITTSALRNLYNDFDKSKCIPVIPTRWKTDDIELMNMRRLDLILIELEKQAEVEKEKEEEKAESKNSKANWEEDSEKNLEKQSSEKECGETISLGEMLKNAKDLVKKQIKFVGMDSKNKTSSIKNEAINLSKILSGQILLSSEIWGGEFLVNIDTNITEGGVSISENEMLVAIISYGLLEILVEDTVQMGICTELEERMEEKYGIAVQFLGVNNPNAQIFLKKGNKINVKH